MFNSDQNPAPRDPFLRRLYESGQRARRLWGSSKTVPPPPLPRDEGGWHVAPAPDGRGMPEQHKSPPPHRLRVFWIVALALLAVNWISALAVQPSGQPRVKVPFSPYFLAQVQAGEVKSISSGGDTIKGTFVFNRP